MGHDDCLRQFKLITNEALRQAIILAMQDDWIVAEYYNIDDEGKNEYDNPIVKQIMAME